MHYFTFENVDIILLPSDIGEGRKKKVVIVNFRPKLLFLSLLDKSYSNLLKAEKNDKEQG